MTPSARIAAAIEVLEAIEASPQRPADAVANEYLRARRFIGSGDRRDISERVWQVARARRRLEWGLRGKPPSARLLVAASLLLESGSSMADLARAFSGGRFAPAPLDHEERATLSRLEGRELDDPAMPRAVRLDIPDWVLPRLEARFGAMLEPELAALRAPAPLDLRANTLKATREAARATLLREGIEAEPTPLSPWGLRVDGRRPVVTSGAFRVGLVEIQDEGSQLVAALAGAWPGMRVCDYCAGAGGKTLAMAMEMANRGHVTACDVSAARLAGAVPRLRRAGIHNVECHALVPGDKWAKRRAGSFDRVLVDAPCTGTGAWRRNPAARLRLVPDDLARLVREQAAIMHQAAALVRNGGRLVYATCSVLLEENEDQVSAFVGSHPEFVVQPIGLGWRADIPRIGDGPYLFLTPRQHGTDGYFAAVLERVA